MKMYKLCIKFYLSNPILYQCLILLPAGASLLPGGPFLILTPLLSSYRRQLWITVQPVTHVEQGQETFTKPVAVWLRVEGVIDSGGHKVLVGGQGHNRTRTIQVIIQNMFLFSRSDCLSGNTRYIHFTSNNVLLLQCSEKRCDSFIAMHLGVLEHPRYLVNMTFTGLEIVDKHFNILPIAGSTGNECIRIFGRNF